MKALAVCALALAAGGSVLAADPPWEPPKISVSTGALKFTPLSDTPSTYVMGTRVGNGEVDDPVLWPGTYVGQATDIHCTATLIGPSVLLTAAHCIASGGAIEILKSDGETLAKGTCERAPGWTLASPSLDIALCLMKPAVVAPFVVYESISFDPDRLPKDKKVRLIGYGCRDYKHPAPLKALTKGDALVEYMPNTFKAWPNWAVTHSYVKDQSAYICDGDSGSAIYFTHGNLRQVVGVASAFEQRADHPQYGRSYFTPLSTEPARQFVTKWVDKRKAGVCGLGEFQHQRCRPLEP